MIDQRIAVFQNVLGKYHFQRPSSIEAKRYMRSDKREILASVLKKQGVYSAILGLILIVYLKAKKIGISLSIVQSAIVLGVICAGSIIIVTSVTVYSIYKFSGTASIDKDLSRTQKVSEKSGIETRRFGTRHEYKVPPGNSEFRINIESLSNENIDAAVAKDVTNRFVGLFRKKYGNDSVVFQGGDNNKRNAGIIFLGSFGKIGTKYIISTRLVNLESGKILYSSSEMMNSLNEIDAACKKIMDNMTPYVRK
jgi:hypothetical protein